MTKHYHTSFDYIYNDTKHDINTLKIDKLLIIYIFNTGLCYFKKTNGSYISPIDVFKDISKIESLRSTTWWFLVKKS